MKVKRLVVTTPQGLAGTLEKESRFVFNYQTTDRKCEASLLMPLRAESYSDGRLFSVFEMNRPEGYLLDYLRQRFGKHETLDDMRLLQITGGNQIGRLRYSEDGRAVAREASVPRAEIIASKWRAASIAILARGGEVPTGILCTAIFSASRRRSPRPGPGGCGRGRSIL